MVRLAIVALRMHPFFKVLPDLVEGVWLDLVVQRVLLGRVIVRQSLCHVLFNAKALLVDVAKHHFGFGVFHVSRSLVVPHGLLLEAFATLTDLEELAVGVVTVALGSVLEPLLQH